MQAAIISAFGEIDVLEFGEVPTPQPGPGEGGPPSSLSVVFSPSASGCAAG